MKKVKKFQNSLNNGQTFASEGKHTEALNEFKTAEELEPNHNSFAATILLGQCKALLNVK
jgi:hypothetical protein